MPSVRALRLGLVAVLATGAMAMPARADTPLHPGAELRSPSGCTLGFVFTDGEHSYISTAGHCTNRVGERAATAGTGPFGTVVFRRESGLDDVAFIHVDQHMEPLLDPGVHGWGGPSGVTSPATVARGDLIGITGFGLGFGMTEATRARPGVLVIHDNQAFAAEAPAIFGDSGGPVVHLPTGRALGIVGGLTPTVPPSTLFGTTVARALVLAAEDGLHLSLVTV